MSDNTSIEWTDATWPVVVGCERISPGCAACYAVRDSRRLAGNPHPKVSATYSGLVERKGNGQLDWTGVVRPLPDRLDWPLKWRKPRKIFVCNESDLFHQDVPDAFIDSVFAVMASCPQHTFQILTKRPERMHRYVAELGAEISDAMARGAGAARWDAARRWVYGHVQGSRKEFVGVRLAYPTWPLSNVWLGVSCENQEAANERIPLLLQTPAAVRFVSAEPLLGPIDLEAVPLPVPGAAFYGLTGVAQPTSEKDTEPDDWKYWTRRSARLDWVIVGFESGPHARPGAEEWIESLIEQCDAAGTACFVKQLGARPVRRTQKSFHNFPNWVNKASTRIERGEVCIDALGRVCARGSDFQRADQEKAFPVTIYAPLKLSHRKGGDMSEWPEDLRVRQFPVPRREAVSE